MPVRSGMARRSSACCWSCARWGRRCAGPRQPARDGPWIGPAARRGGAASSVARRLAAIRAWTRFLLRERMIADDPALDVAPARLPQRLPGVLTVGEGERLRAQPHGASPLALRDRAILELLYAAGLRVSEL